MLIKVYIDLPYTKNRSFTRKVRKAIEDYIINDDTDIFKYITNFFVGYIDGREPIPKSEGMYTYVNMIFDFKLPETEQENEGLKKIKELTELRIFEIINDIKDKLENEEVKNGNHVEEQWKVKNREKTK